MLPMDELDYLVSSTGGDMIKIEKALGFDSGQLSSGKYKIAFINDASSNSAFPSGKEAGANEKWIPGGVTSGGISEATYNGSTHERDHVTMTLTEFFGN